MAKHNTITCSSRRIPVGNQSKIKIVQNPSGPSSWDPKQSLADALEQRERFLEQYPKYRKFQHEIDRLLDKAGSSENRMRVLALLMETKLIEMQAQLKKLNSILIKTVT